MCSSPQNACKNTLTVVKLICNLLCLICFLLQDLNAQDQDEDPMNKLKGQKIVSCRICKGDHWTTRCPYKDTLGPMQKELAEQLGLSTGDKDKPAGSGTISTTIHIISFNGRLFLKFWLMWSVSLLFHQRSRSLHSLHRARPGSTCPRAWGMEGRGEGSPCSPTGEVGVSSFTCLFYAPILHFSHCTTARGLLGINSICFLLTADDNATIRVTNLSEDTRETDLQELFRPFGSISRIYLAKDKNTGQSKVSARLNNTNTCMLKNSNHL